MKPFPLRALKAWNDGRWAPHVAAFGGGGGSTNTIQKSDPWGGQQPSLIDIYAQANNDYYNHIPQYFPNSTYAPLQSAQQSFQNQAMDFGSQGGGQALRAANQGIASFMSPTYTDQTAGTYWQGQGVLSNELNPGYLDPWNSPSFQTVVGNTLANAIPAATSSFTNGNRTGSGLATRAATMAATDAVGNLAQTQYQKNQDIQNTAQQQAANQYLTQQGNQIKAAAVAPMIDTSQLQDLNAGLQASNMSQTDLQNQINAQVQKWNYGEMLPWNMLQNYEAAIMGTGNPGGSSTTTQPYYSNDAANLLAGAGALGTAASGLAATGAFGNAGWIAGLLGSISDERLKKDIVKIGESDSGFPLYTFRYVWEGPISPVHIGVMAQDVVKSRPEAIHYTSDGFMTVDYDKALAT